MNRQEREEERLTGSSRRFPIARNRTPGTKCCPVDGRGYKSVRWRENRGLGYEGDWP
jgi:hypothetical protein